MRAIERPRGLDRFGLVWTGGSWMHRSRTRRRALVGRKERGERRILEGRKEGQTPVEEQGAGLREKERLGRRRTID